MSVAFSSNSQMLASGSKDKTVRLWRSYWLSTWGADHIDERTVSCNLIGHTGEVNCVAFSADNQWLASGSNDNTVFLWRMPAGSLNHKLIGHNAAVNSVAFSRDNQWLVTGSNDHSVRLWGLQVQGQMLQILLYWSTHDYLLTWNADLSGVRDLSPSNAKLLEQHGAINTPQLVSDSAVAVPEEIMPEVLTATLLKEQQEARDQIVSVTLRSIVPRYRQSPLPLKNHDWQLTWLISNITQHNLLLEGVDAQGQVDLTWLHFINDTVQKFSVLPNIAKQLLLNTELCTCKIKEEEANSLIKKVDEAIQTKEKIVKPNEWIHKKWCELKFPVVGKRKLPALSKRQDYAVIEPCGEHITRESKESEGYTLITTDRGIKITLIKENRLVALAKALADCQNALDIDLSHNEIADPLEILNLSKVLANLPRLQVLRLSHNRINEEGLTILLGAIQHHPALEQALLDYNYISFDAYYAEHKLLKFLQNAKLKNLDLSMNFIHRGVVSGGVNARDGKPIVVVYDKKTLNDCFTEPKRIYCKTLFHQEKRLNSLFLQPVTSCVAPSLQRIGIDSGVVSLFANKTGGDHAYLALEGIHRFGQRYIIMAELYEGANKSILIQVCETTPNNFYYRTRDLDNVFTKNSYCSKEQLKKLLNIIFESRNKQGMYRYALLPDKSKNQYNCLTWALDMLQQGGIIKSNETNTWLPSPQREVGNQRDCVIS